MGSVSATECDAREACDGAFVSFRTKFQMSDYYTVYTFGGI